VDGTKKQWVEANNWKRNQSTAVETMHNKAALCHPTDVTKQSGLKLIDRSNAKQKKKGWEKSQPFLWVVSNILCKRRFRFNLALELFRSRSRGCANVGAIFASTFA
jgi:hypothetical protein